MTYNVVWVFYLSLTQGGGSIDILLLKPLVSCPVLFCYASGCLVLRLAADDVQLGKSGESQGSGKGANNDTSDYASITTGLTDPHRGESVSIG
jgi:hypothetical protein